jgi:glycosyltransferase involved in cell wall biosynthesis
MRVIARMNVGGPAVQVTGLMRGFNQEEFDQRLYTGFCSMDEADYLNTIALDVSAKRINGLGRRVNLLGDLTAFFALCREVREFKPDIIHTHTAKAGFLGRFAAILVAPGAIRIHTFHGHLLNGYFGPFKRFFVVTAERVLALVTDQLLAVGDKVRLDLINAGIGSARKFDLMPPGLELSKLPNKIESQISYDLDIARIQCAIIGRITKIKRLDRFLDVVGEVKKRGVSMDFFMAGDGELLESCRTRIINENLPVKVLGWQINIEKVLSAADIVILTSDNEGTPLSLIQAGMAGLPVVTTRVGSVPEVVLDGVTGVITSLDVEEIAEALENLAKNEKLRGRLGASAQEFTMANFGVKRLVDDHEKLYKKLLVNRAKS